MRFHKLQIKDYLILASIILLVYFYIMVDQFFVPVALRPFAVLIVIITLLVSFFFFIRPKSVIGLGNTLLLCLGGAATIIVVIQHILISFDFNPKVLIILLVTYISPYLSGLMYFMLIKSRRNI